MASVLAVTIANRWFTKGRRLAMGLLSASSATGQIQFLPLLAFLISVSGWRAASLTVAAVAILLVPFVLLLMKNRPEDIGPRAYGATEDAPLVQSRGNPIATSFRGLRLASHSGGFWLLAECIFVYGWIFASHQVGAAFAAFAAGAIRTWMGDYQLAFVSAGVLCLLAAALVVRLPSSRHEHIAALAPCSTEASLV